VTYNGVDPRFAPPDPVVLDAFRRRAGLPEQFILFIGTLEPRKNVPTLLEAYARIASETNVPLILGGGKGWLYDEIFAKAEQLNLGDRIRFAGFIDDADLPLWYAAATVFTLPSLYEGFGIPLIEAMACGTPVVASTSSSLPEIVGDAGLLVSPTDPDALGAAILRILREPDLRAELREQGFVRARRFSWYETAQRTLDVYRRASSIS
jgi:glycosyltransferase involved in cell wall biosynthesis